MMIEGDLEPFEGFIGFAPDSVDLSNLIGKTLLIL